MGETAFRDSALFWHSHDGQSRQFDALLVDDVASNFTIVLLPNNKHHKLDAIAAAIQSILKQAPFTLLR